MALAYRVSIALQCRQCVNMAATACGCVVTSLQACHHRAASVCTDQEQLGEGFDNSRLGEQR
jgi:hypothetical protein